jgi:molybdenum cofactor synthesis domain-containing protein
VRPTLFTDVLPFDEALRRVLAAASPVTATETVALSGAAGRVAARDVPAAADVPAFDRAAMDGYAVVAEDTRGATLDAPRRLTLAGRVFTGETPAARLGAGTCMEIATGAPLPPGATAVVMVERTARDGDAIQVFSQVDAGQHIGRRGADIRQGDRAIGAGDLLTPGRIGALAAVGATSVEVYARPAVAILSTGNEVVAPGDPLGPGQVYDINRFTLEAVTRQHGGTPRMIPRATDTMAALDAALDAVSDSDIAVFSGGSSVGGRDLMADALAARGEVIFHGIAVKPGKPTLFGRLGRTLVFGMPGYPASCLSNAYVLLVPLVRATARLPPWRPETIALPLSRRVKSAPDRHQFYTVRIAGGQAEPAFKSSGDISSIAAADGFIEVPLGVESIESGTVVVVTLF